MPIWIATAFSAARGIAAKIPLWAYGAIAALLALFMAYQLGKSAERSECDAEAAKIATKAVEQARKADSDAAATVKDKTDAVEQGNARAREAANAGDDPLRDGFNSLRGEKAGNRPATR